MIRLKLLLEEVSLDSSVESELQDLAKDIVQGIEQREVKEAVGLMAIGGILAIPAVIEGLGSLVKLISKLISSKNKGTDFADRLIRIGHKVEKFFIKPIIGAIKKVNPKIKDKEAENLAHLVHKSAIFLLLIASGIGLATAIKKANLTQAAAESVLTAIKSTELAKFVSTKI